MSNPSNNIAVRRKQLIIDCKYRDVGSNQSFEMGIEDTIYRRVHRIALVSLTMKNSMYNINAYNNVLDYTKDASPFSVTLTAGQYTSATLITAINNAQTDFSVSLQAIQNRFLFTRLAGTTIVVLGSSIMAEVLGLGVSVNLTFTSTGLAPYIPDLAGVSNIYIASRILGMGGATLSKQTRNIFAVVPCNADFGSVINYHAETSSEESSILYYDTPKNIRNIDIELWDERGRALLLNTENDCILQFKVYIS